MDDNKKSSSSHQKKILEQFRINLEDHLTPHHTDAVLLKWLKAGNFDLRKAEQNFREDQESRKTYGLENIAETYVKPEVLKKHERTCFLGFAKDGSPVRFAAVHADYNGFLHSVSSYNLLSFFCNLLESDIKVMEERNKKTGQNSSEITYILDMDGFSFKDIWYRCVIEAGLELLTLYQDHFPELWNIVFIVNVPCIFDKILNIFKPVLRSSLQEMFKIAPKSSTSQLLRKYIDDDVLPAYLGGTRVDSEGDPFCREFITGYFKIPEKYYLRNTMHFIDESDPGVNVVTIEARNLHNVPLVLKEEGTKIRLETRTENGGIHFTILYREYTSDSGNPRLPGSDERLDPNDESSNVRVVGSRTKHQSHIVPCDGTYTASWPGIYIFQFDNTTSWFGSRKLYYRITVSHPDF